MKLLSFLGTGNYSSVTYIWDKHEYQTDLFPEAMAVWNQPAEMLVLLTAEAKAHRNWAELQKRLASKVALRPVDIPSGKNESELWQIFTSLTECLNEGDKVIFDVTHAFRSLPMLVLLATAYLRVAKPVDLEAVLYGAFEARDDDNRAPVFNLTPFLSLLEWATATDKFAKTGEGSELAYLLKEAHHLPWRAVSSQAQRNLPHHLQGLGTTLESLSHSLELARPNEVSKHAAALSERLEKAKDEIEQWARPFVVLLERTHSVYKPFTSDTLATQRNLVRWYIERQQVVQAVTLSREWLISWVGYQLGKDQLAERADVEEAITQAELRRRDKTIEKESPLLASLVAMPDFDILIQAWGAVSDLRNDVAHCGMRPQPRTALSIVQSTNRLADQLDRLPLQEEENRP